MADIERILIVGGGITGLTVATALYRQGFEPELDGNLEHILRIKRHPRSAFRLFQVSARRQWRAAVGCAAFTRGQKRNVPARIGPRI